MYNVHPHPPTSLQKGGALRTAKPPSWFVELLLIRTECLLRATVLGAREARSKSEVPALTSAPSRQAVVEVVCLYVLADGDKGGPQAGGGWARPGQVERGCP